MLLFEQELEVPAVSRCDGLIAYLRNRLEDRFPPNVHAVRFAVMETDDTRMLCEIGSFATSAGAPTQRPSSLFAFRPRTTEDISAFVAVMIVPTGVGASIGGHAGDATPAMQLLAQACDTLVTHPNVVNASDIAELPLNALYVEGSLLTRLMMGTLGLQRVRSNRVLVVVEPHPEQTFTHDTINAVNAARSTYGLSCPQVVLVESPFKMRARLTSSGSAAGRVENLRPLFEILEAKRKEYDAVAIASLVDVPDHAQEEYFRSERETVNPWGGVEAMLTHAISSIFNVPSAHAPMMESMKVANMDFGVVDPRKAAEMISLTFFNCVLKGLHRAPKVVTDPEAMRDGSVLTVEDISVLIQPDGCLGLPTLAALEQGIPVIAVRENRNIMKNDLRELPWAPGQFHLVENYWEAAGLMLAMRAGISPTSVRRPLARVPVRGLGQASDSADEQTAGPRPGRQCAGAAESAASFNQ